MVLFTFTSDSNNGGKYTTKFVPRFTMKGRPDDFKMALVSSTICRAWPTIGAALRNNKVTYKTAVGQPDKVITINDGQYTYELLDSVIKKTMKANGDYGVSAEGDDYFVEIGANLATGRVVITVKNGYVFNIAPTISDITYDLRPILGFTQTTFTQSGINDSVNEGDKIPDFNGGITELQVRCDLVDSNNAFANGKSEPILYTFTPDKSPHAYMIKEPSQRLWLGVNTNVIDSVTIWLTDQDGNSLTTGGEKTTVTVEIAKW